MSLYSDTVLKDKPIAYWRLGEISGDPQDASGYGHDAATHGGIGYGVAGALFGDSDTAMSFDGATAYISTAAAADLNALSSAFSVEAWIRRATSGNLNGAVFEKTVGGGVNTHFAVMHDVGSLTFRIQRAVGGQLDLTYADSFAVGTWHHWVSSYDGTSMRSYLDGALVAGPLAASVPVTGSGISTIGALNSGSIYFWNGNLDEVAIYNKALSAQQVLTHYVTGAVVGVGYAASTSGALKGFLEAQGLGISVYRDQAPDNAPRPYVVVTEAVSIIPDGLEDGAIGTVKEHATVDLWMDWKNLTTGKLVESYSLPGSVGKALEGSRLMSVGPSKPPQTVYGVLVHSIGPRIVEMDDNLVHVPFWVEVWRNP